jgi:hypothetical protein
MLYPINPPSCSPALDWAVQLQRDLITALCDTNTTPDMVTPQWVRALRPDPPEIADWLEALAGRSFQKVNFIDAMKLIAGLDDANKRTVLSYYTNNHLFTQAFAPGQDPPATIDITSAGDKSVQTAIKTLFVGFYVIGFGEKGFPVVAVGGTLDFSNRKMFVGLFKDENQMTVCPLCDGDFNGPEIDHWLPEGKYPALSCHPRNLVPICHDCNKPGCKHEKPPLTPGAPRPFDDWFHPYERPAVGHFSIDISNGKSVRLVGTDIEQQKRIDNLDALINLSRRWSDAYQRQKADYLSKLAGKVRNKRIPVEPAALLDTVQEWIEELDDTRFDRRYSLIKMKILGAVMDPGSATFSAWLQHMDDATK